MPTTKSSAVTAERSRWLAQAYCARPPSCRRRRRRRAARTVHCCVRRRATLIAQETCTTCTPCLVRVLRARACVHQHGSAPLAAVGTTEIFRPLVAWAHSRSPVSFPCFHLPFPTRRLGQRAHSPLVASRAEGGAAVDPGHVATHVRRPLGAGHVCRRGADRSARPARSCGASGCGG